MKKFNFKKFANVLAGMAMMFSIVAVNTRCVFIFHQPKMPEAMKKLKKYQYGWNFKFTGRLFIEE